MDIDKICYKVNPLKEVIARIDFLSPILDLEKGLPHGLTEIIKSEFPIAESQEIISREFQITPADVQQKAIKGTEWLFFNKNRTKRLSLSANSMFIVHNEYETFETFSKDFLKINSVVFGMSNEIYVKRFGVRYVNNLIIDDGHPLDWSKYLNDNLLSIFNIPASRESISRAFQNLELNLGDYSLRFQFGMHNPDYPAAIRLKSFILDFDCYYSGVIGKQEVEDFLPKFHHSIQELFELSIKEDYRKRLGYVK